MSDLPPDFCFFFHERRWPLPFAPEKYGFSRCERLTEPWEEAAGAVLRGVLLNASARNQATRLTRERVPMSLCRFLSRIQGGIVMWRDSLSVISLFPNLPEAHSRFSKQQLLPFFKKKKKKKFFPMQPLKDFCLCL